ncbi:MAG TPA: calcium-binding protein [Planctomycetota bacterium]|nr:calcium-binding protein [Planctomycetota bacterium]
MTPRTHWPRLAAALLAVATVPAQGAVQRQSRSASGSDANGLSGVSAISADARFVGFSSAASNLVANDSNGRVDVFVRDRITGDIERVSVATGGGQADLQSYWPSLSSDGRLVVFHSDASNLVPGDTNGIDDVFVRDRLAGTTTRVDVSAIGAQADGASQAPWISADGRFVAFQSTATTLVPPDNSLTDVFVVELATGAIECASRGLGGVLGNGGSYQPSLSADGRYVAFHSTSSNLVTGDTNGVRDVFVRDRQLGTTTRVSVASNGVQGNNTSWRATISCDGNTVAFNSLATNLVAGDTNGTDDVFVHDIALGTTERASVSSTAAQGTGSAGLDSAPDLSDDGRYVAFLTAMSGLVADDVNGLTDAFVHDRTTGSTRRVSEDAAGVPGSLGASVQIVFPVHFWTDRVDLSGDGRVVVFASRSADLFPGGASFENVYATDLGVAAVETGPATLGGVATVDLSANAYAGMGYIAAFAFGYQSGVVLPGTWRMPLDADGLFGLSVGAGGIFSNMSGALDATGHTQWGVAIPPFPFLLGVPMSTAAAIVDASAPLGLWSVSNVVRFTIH